MTLDRPLSDSYTNQDQRGHGSQLWGYLASRATQSAEIHIPPASEGLAELGLPSGTGSWVIYAEAVGQDHELVRAEEFQSAFLRTGKALCRRDQGRFGDQSWTSLVPGQNIQTEEWSI